jgi:hypothetical protein
VIKKILFIFSVLTSGLVAGQQQQLPLKQVLAQIEQQYNARFSYLDEAIDSISVEMPAASLRFRESVTFLKKRTPLSYTFIDELQVAISALPAKAYVCGLITDFQDTPIANALIQSETHTYTSDADGFFRAPFKDLQGEITISALNFRSLTTRMTQPSDMPCPKIILPSKIEVLDEVYITNYITKGINRQSDGSIRIDFTEAGILPGVIESDVLLAAQALPGIQSVNERVSDLNIRGGNQDQNLILWDGIKMYQSGHFFGLISAINPNLTDQVTFYKNGTPSRYTDGVSGTIAMRSDKEITRDVKLQFDLNLINTGGFIDLPLGDKSSIQLSARRSISELLETPTYNEYFNRVFQDTEVIRDGINSTTNIDQELFSFFDTSLRWIYQPNPKDRIQVNGFIIDNQIQFRESAVIDGIRERQQSNAIQRNAAASLRYDRKWSERFDMLAQVYLTNYKLEGTNVDVQNSQRLIQTNEVLENTLRLEGDYRIKDNATLEFGYQFVETGITNSQDVNNPLFRQSIKEVIRAHALYSGLDYTSPNKRSRYVLGARTQYYDKLEVLRFEPRFNYTYKVSSRLTLEAAGEVKSQVTSQAIDFQSDFLGIESRRWVLANNTTVPVTTSKQLSLGIAYQKNNWLISAEGYHKEVEGITVQGQGFQNQLQFVRGTGGYTTSGVDLLIHKRWNRFDVRTGYTFAVNDYVFDALPNDIPLRFHNNVDIRHIIKSAFSYTHNQLKMALGVNWHTGKPVTSLVAGQEVQNNGLNFNTPNTSNLPDYLRFDISGSYAFRLSKDTLGELGFSIWNLFNNNNIVNQYFLLSNEQPNTLQERALRFTPNLSFKIKYN